MTVVCVSSPRHQNFVPGILLDYQHALTIEGQSQTRGNADLVLRRGEKLRRMQPVQGMNAVDQRLDHLAVSGVGPSANRLQVLACSLPGRKPQ